MKKAASILSVLFIILIIFFSIFGEKLYYSTKPKVELERPMSFDGMLIVPRTAIFHDAGGYCVIAVESEQGFSTVILTTRKIRLTGAMPDTTGYFGEGYFLVRTAGNVPGPIVVKTSKQLRGGQRVVEGTVSG